MTQEEAIRAAAERITDDICERLEINAPEIVLSIVARHLGGIVEKPVAERNWDDYRGMEYPLEALPGLWKKLVAELKDHAEEVKESDSGLSLRFLNRAISINACAEQLEWALAHRSPIPQDLEGLRELVQEMRRHANRDRSVGADAGPTHELIASTEDYWANRLEKLLKATP